MASLGRFLSRHRRGEEAAAEAVGADVVWAVLRRLGIFGAGVASAAVLANVTSTTSTHHPTFSLSAKGAAFITRNEGVRYTPYNDPYNCTVGVGHLIHYGVCSRRELTEKITQAQSAALLMRDASSAVAAVRQDVTRKIDQPQFDALVDFTFNVGTGGLRTSRVLRDVNAGNDGDIGSALAAWSYASGHYLAGLARRRDAETHLYLTGDYGPGIGIYTPPKKPARKKSPHKKAATAAPPLRSENGAGEKHLNLPGRR